MSEARRSAAERLDDVARFLRGCRGTEPAEYFERHAQGIEEAAGLLRSEGREPDAEVTCPDPKCRGTTLHRGVETGALYCPSCKRQVTGPAVGTPSDSPDRDDGERSTTSDRDERTQAVDEKDCFRCGAPVRHFEMGEYIDGTYHHRFEIECHNATRDEICRLRSERDEALRERRQAAQALEDYIADSLAASGTAVGAVEKLSTELERKETALRDVRLEVDRRVTPRSTDENVSAMAGALVRIKAIVRRGLARAGDDG